MRSITAVTALVLSLFLTSAVGNPVPVDNAVGQNIQIRDADYHDYNDDKKYHKEHEPYDYKKKECDYYKDIYQDYRKKIKDECDGRSHDRELEKKCKFYKDIYDEYKKKYDYECN